MVRRPRFQTQRLESLSARRRNRRVNKLSRDAATAVIVIDFQVRDVSLARSGRTNVD